MASKLNWRKTMLGVVTPAEPLKTPDCGVKETDVSVWFWPLLDIPADNVFSFRMPDWFLVLLALLRGGVDGDAEDVMSANLC